MHKGSGSIRGKTYSAGKILVRFMIEHANNNDKTTAKLWLIKGDHD